MANIYYPQGSRILQRNTVSSSYYEEVIGVLPNVVFFFNSGSQLDWISSSVFSLTASVAINAISASYAPGSPSISASYALTASYALNGGGGPSISSSYSETSSYSLFAEKCPLTASLFTVENLSISSLVNIFYNSGSYLVRLADYSDINREATAFVSSSYSSGSLATVYFDGIIGGLSGLTTGDQYLGSSGSITGSYPTTSNYCVQYVGKAISPTEIQFLPSAIIKLSSNSTASLNLTFTSASYAQTSSFALNGGGAPVRADASEFIPRTTNGCGIDSQETNVNKINRDLLTFDAAATEYAQFWFSWPSGWSSAQVSFLWSATGSAGDVVWAASMKCFNDGDLWDSELSTTQSIVDTLVTTGSFKQSNFTPTITPTGSIALGNRTLLQIFRDSTNINDTLAVDALLEGVIIQSGA